MLPSVLNTSPSTVGRWKIGEKYLSRLLDLLERKGLETVLWLISAKSHPW